MNNIVVSFPVKNEAPNIIQVLNALENQTHKPIKVIIANDGSTDNTKELALKYEFVNIIDLDKREGSLVGKKEMANIFNACIEPVKNIHSYSKVDYLLIIGGDTILPPYYIEKLIQKFERNSNLMIASGQITGINKTQYSGFMVPGAGRMLKYSYWLSLGGLFPINEGWEAYPIYKANLDGYETKVFDDISFGLLRPTGGRTDYFAYGKAMKALGYSKIFALGRILKQPFLKGKSIFTSISMLLGYIFGKTELYEKDLRKFVKKYQLKRLKLKR